MIIDRKILEELLAAAKESPRLRMVMDLRDSEKDQSQRMLNAMLPGTEVPIHRHETTSEMVAILYGRLTEVYYDENGQVTEKITLDANGECRAMSIPQGQWHTVEVTEPCVIIEAKDGPYKPRTAGEVMTYGQVKN